MYEKKKKQSYIVFSLIHRQNHSGMISAQNGKKRKSLKNKGKNISNPRECMTKNAKILFKN